MTQIPIRTVSTDLSPTRLSPTRSVLCSRAHAIRVASRMADEGLAVSVVATLDPLQPWRVIEHDVTPEATGGEHAACA